MSTRWQILVACLVFMMMTSFLGSPTFAIGLYGTFIALLVGRVLDEVRVCEHIKGDQ